MGPGELGPGWGTVDYEDVMAVTDEALKRFDFLDEERLGVIGGSYGGYMTSWIVGHTNRFKAACSERAVNQIVSMYGSSDIGWVFKGYHGEFVHDAVDLYLQISPWTYAKQIETPLLILHSEQDLRCNIEQADQLFTTLRLLKRDVELVRFPAESHELTRSGQSGAPRAALRAPARVVRPLPEVVRTAAPQDTSLPQCPAAAGARSCGHDHWRPPRPLLRHHRLPLLAGCDGHPPPPLPRVAFSPRLKRTCPRDCPWDTSGSALAESSLGRLHRLPLGRARLAATP